MCAARRRATMPASRRAGRGCNRRSSSSSRPITARSATTTPPILFSEGVVKGRITLNEFVAFTATNHARMYGLHPRKGSIAIGSDADIAIWEADRRTKITAQNLHQGADYTPYE